MFDPNILDLEENQVMIKYLETEGALNAFYLLL